MAKRKDKKYFINECINKYDNKYDYSLVEYKNNRTKIKIICKEHGIFEVKPYNFLNGSECPSCGFRLKLDNNSFINKSNKIHDNKYDYSLVKYKNNKTKVKIICKEHGEFNQRPNEHLLGQGCPSCKYDKIKNIKLLGNNVFIEKSNEIHNNRYNYLLVDYKHSEKKVNIICEKHGVFKQTPHNHLSGQGCPKCKMSKGEILIESYLIKNNIKYDYQKKFNDCKSPNNRYMYFDFYLPKYNLVIEYDGQQHYNPIKIFGGHERYELQKKYDLIKTNYCFDNKLELIRIPFNKINEISIILTNKINEYE